MQSRSDLQTEGKLRTIVLALAMAMAAPVIALGQEEKKTEDGWIPLFNGKNLDGWTPKIRGYEVGENFGNTFRVEDGILKVSYDEYPEFGDRFGHLFTNKTFSHYKLRVEYRFVGDQVKGGPPWAFRNNGLMIHGQTAESMRKDQSFPVSIEVQLLGGDGQQERPTANVCSPGTHIVMDGELITKHCNNSRSKTFHGDQWVTVEVEVHGDGQIIHRVNGEEVLSYEKPQLDDEDEDGRRLLEAGHPRLIKEGTISIQAESHPTEFRKIEILPLEK